MSSEAVWVSAIVAFVMDLITEILRYLQRSRCRIEMELDEEKEKEKQNEI